DHVCRSPLAGRQVNDGRLLGFLEAPLREFHKHARDNGLDVPEVDDTFYHMTEFRIEDPDGNRLWIGQVK
ncbi:hypothetical protein, partial [Xanthomonas populi]|uniref:hypothetical protein n=1 Tax=Xanthomonas populi TaxID=53414 RepID=UPI001ABF1ED6